MCHKIIYILKAKWIYIFDPIHSSILHGALTANALEIVLYDITELRSVRSRKVLFNYCGPWEEYVKKKTAPATSPLPLIGNL